MCYETAQGTVGEARAGIWASGQSGLLWFFDRDNAEVLVKVLDGCSHNGRRWVFVAPVTDVAFNLHITSSGGRQWTHRNPLGQTAVTRSDTSAFVCADDDGARSATATGMQPEIVTGQAAVRSPISRGEYTDCRPATTPLLFDGGYQVSLCYETAQGAVGEARAGIWSSNQSGLLWFFDRDNAEVLVKVLDGCSQNGRRWVFVAPVTDVAFNLHVTSNSGRQWTHRNRLGETATTSSDTAAFDCATDDVESIYWYDDSFTDSTGRTLLYRLWVRSDWDLKVPRGVVLFFHGNNVGTAEEWRTYRWSIVDDALELGLAAIVPASPESMPEGVSFGEWTLVPTSTGRGGERFWSTPEDARLVHELLQGNLNSRLEIDHDRVVFSGGSQGTCFLAEFVEFYGGSYGGGFHAWCGCFWLDFDGDDSHDTYAVTPPFLASPWGPTFQWTPFAASVVRDRFKVFVEATTEDFLYPAAVSMSRYYPEWLGLDTRTDLEAAGGHCDPGTTPRSENLRLAVFGYRAGASWNS